MGHLELVGDPYCYKGHHMTEYCVIYHAHCSDGLGAAWALWRLLGDSASYYPANHGSSPPNVEGRHVIIVDFAYPKEILLSIKDRSKSLIVLDHHKSAYEDLHDLPFARFDMARSGAGMAWDHFHQTPRPPIIDYIEDRDLWAWKLPNSKEILASFECVKPSFESLNEFNSKLEEPTLRAEIISRGSGIIEYKNAKVRSLAERAYLVDLSAICGLEDPTIQVPCVNTQVFHSEVGNLLASKHPMAIMWYRADDGTYRHSLRSSDRMDCSQIARFWGGGGHANAAGFTTLDPLPAVQAKT